MKNKIVLGIVISLLVTPFLSKAMRGDDVEAPRDIDTTTDTGPRKEEPKKGGLLEGLRNLLSGSKGGTSTSKGKPTTDKTVTTGDKTTTTSGSTPVVGRPDGNKGVTAREAKAEQALGKGKNFATSKPSTVQSSAKTVEEQQEIVTKSDLPVVQRSIVKSILTGPGRNDATLLIGAMKNVEMEIIDAMTGTRSHVVSDHNLTEAEFVKKLELIREGCLHRLATRTDDPVGREFDIEKLRITGTLLAPQNAGVRERLFYEEIEPKIRERKNGLRSRGGGR